MYKKYIKHQYIQWCINIKQTSVYLPPKPTHWGTDGPVGVPHEFLLELTPISPLGITITMTFILIFLLFLYTIIVNVFISKNIVYLCLLNIT